MQKLNLLDAKRFGEARHESGAHIRNCNAGILSESFVWRNDDGLRIVAPKRTRAGGRLLKADDSQPWREQLLYAWTHDLTYDRQCEESRAFYLQTLIEFSRDAEFYRDRIIACLATDDDDLDLTQMFELAIAFANQCSEARNAMYAAFDRRGFVGAGSRTVILSVDRGTSAENSYSAVQMSLV